MKQIHDYTAPRIEVLAVTPEQGFAASPALSTEDYTTENGTW